MCLTFTLWNFLGLFFQKNDHQRQSFRKGFFPKPFQVFFGKKLFLTVDLCREKKLFPFESLRIHDSKAKPSQFRQPLFNKKWHNGLLHCLPLGYFCGDDFDGVKITLFQGLISLELFSKNGLLANTRNN